MRKYEEIWEKLKRTKMDQWVMVHFKSDHQLQTIINMVKKEKCSANITRKRLDLPSFGKLVIKRDPEAKRVYFSLSNSGDAL